MKLLKIKIKVKGVVRTKNTAEKNCASCEKKEAGNSVNVGAFYDIFKRLHKVRSQ